MSKCEEIFQILHLIIFMVCGAISTVYIHIVYVIVGVHNWYDAEKNTPANGLHHASRKKAETPID